MSTPSNAIEPSGVRRASRGPTKVFEGHNGWINAVAYFPDGRRIATASNNAVIIWDVESDRQDGQSILHGSKVICIAISPNGRRIASGMEGGVVIWDALTREMVHEIKGDGVHKLAYSPDGCWIATASTDVGREVQLWDADTGKLGREPLGCDGEVFCMGFSPDGSRIAVGFWDGSFEVLDIATGESVIGPIKGHTREVWLVVYSPDGRLLVTGSRDSSIRAWDSKSGVAVGKPMLGHKYGVDCISVSADGRRIASGGDDKTVRVWDLETRLQIGDSFDADGRVNSVAFSPGGRYIISGGDHLYLFNTESLASKGSSSPPTTTARIPPAPITLLHQYRQARTKDTSSISSSLLDLPAVVQQQRYTQQERKPSIDDDWDTEPIRPPLQDPPLKQQTSPVQPVKPGHKWLRNIREQWRHIRHRKPRVQADLSNCSPPIFLHERAQPPTSSELSTNRQARRERDADAQQNTQDAHSRARPSRNQIEANVALAQADVRLAIAAPRGRKGRRFRARAQRGGVQANSHSDTESEVSDAESEYVEVGCLEAICYWVYFRRRRYQQEQ